VLAGTSALWTLPLVRLEGGAPQVSAPASGQAAVGALVQGIRGLAARRGGRELLVVITAQYLMIGALDILYVVLAGEQFSLGPSGPGLLGATFGAGAVVGAVGSTLLVARRRLAPALVAALAAMGALLVVMAVWTVLAPVVVALTLLGICRSVLDVAGRMLLQRSAPQHALASVFATTESLALLGYLLGGVVAQVGIAVEGVRTAIAAIAVALGGLLAWSARRLVEVDEIADAPVVEIRLLRRIALFAPLPGPALEGVARATRPVAVAAGATVVREGDVGDEYWAIAEGDVDVSMGGRYVRTMGRGEGFGEVALLADVPRTATVVARDDVSLLAIERAPVLTAVTGHDASRQAAWAVARAWHPALDAKAPPEVPGGAA
jgi:MFS family permease